MMATQSEIEIRAQLDAYVASERQAGARTMTAKDRARLYERIEGFRLAGLRYSIGRVAPDERPQIFKELVEMSLAYRRRPVAVPVATVRAMLAHPSEGNLAEALFPVACMWVDTRDHRGTGNPPIADLRRGLPRTIRMIYTLFSLEGELCNGGFEQFFGNGHPAQETLADCRLVGAKKLAVLLKSAMALWATEPIEDDDNLILDDAARALEAKRGAAFGELDAEFNALEEKEDLSALIEKYVCKNHGVKRMRALRNGIRKRSSRFRRK